MTDQPNPRPTDAEQKGETCAYRFVEGVDRGGTCGLPKSHPLHDQVTTDARLAMLPGVNLAHPFVAPEPAQSSERCGAFSSADFDGNVNECTNALPCPTHGEPAQSSTVTCPDGDPNCWLCKLRDHHLPADVQPTAECLICGYAKPLGVWKARSNIGVCVECRNKARSDHPAERTAPAASDERLTDEEEAFRAAAHDAQANSGYSEHDWYPRRYEAFRKGWSAALAHARAILSKHRSVHASEVEPLCCYCHASKDTHCQIFHELGEVCEKRAHHAFRASEDLCECGKPFATFLYVGDDGCNHTTDDPSRPSIDVPASEEPWEQFDMLIGALQEIGSGKGDERLFGTIMNSAIEMLTLLRAGRPSIDVKAAAERIRDRIRPLLIDTTTLPKSVLELALRHIADELAKIIRGE